VLASEIVDPGLIDRQIVHYGDYDPFVKYTVQFKDRLPAMGYKTYFVTPSDAPMTIDPGAATEVVETDFYRIAVNPNGTLNIWDKRLNRTFDQVLLLEDGGDDGDGYDYSPLPGEKLIYSHAVQAQAEIRRTAHEAVIEISYTLPVPGDLEQRKAGGLDSAVDVRLRVTVPNHNPILAVRFELDNHAKDHRLRALIPTGIASRCSVADNQFGAIRRPVYDQAMEVWEQEQWEERPDAIYPMLTFVGLSDEDYGVAVLTNSTREYEIVGEAYDTIAITLFRSVGVLGKADLVRRPGRPSGIGLPTPDSQMLRRLALDFAITTHGGATLSANVARIAKEYLTPVLCYNKIPYDAMKLNPANLKTPVRYSFLREVAPTVVLSTLKKAEKGPHFVLRFYNATGKEQAAAFAFGTAVTGVQSANLQEQPFAALDLNENQVRLPVKPNQVRTILFRQ